MLTVGLFDGVLLPSWVNYGAVLLCAKRVCSTRDFCIRIYRSSPSFEYYLLVYIS